MLKLVPFYPNQILLTSYVKSLLLYSIAHKKICIHGLKYVKPQILINSYYNKSKYFILPNFS